MQGPEVLAREIAGTLGLGPCTLEPLAGGGGNHAFLARGQQDCVVIRLGGPVDALGGSRASELAVAQAAAAAGLAPEVLLARPDQGLLVTRYLPAQQPPQAYWREEETLRRMGQWLARLHRLPLAPAMQPIDLVGRASALLPLLPAAEAAALQAGLGQRATLLGPAVSRVPCHHDLHAGNLRDHAGRLWAIDWEYAGAGDPAADLAGFACYHDLEPQELARLLESYAEQGGPARRERVLPLRWVFDCLCYGWSVVAREQGIDPVADPARLRQRLREGAASGLAS